MLKRATHTIRIALSLVLLLLGVSRAARAQDYEFVRITCAPGNGYLALTYETVSQEVVESRNDGARLQDLGFFDPHELDHTCKLGSTTYVISARQEEPHASGTCGAPLGLSDATSRGHGPAGSGDIRRSRG